MQDPIHTLKTAIEELDLFTSSEAAHLELAEDGCLIAIKENLLNRVIGFARLYLRLPLSEDEIQKQEKRRTQLKERLLRLRDFIQKNYSVIVTCQQGTENQRKFAAFALEKIERYNEIVIGSGPKKLLCDEERQCLLLDKEIKGHPIRSYALPIKLDFHSQDKAGIQVLKRLKEHLLNKDSLNSVQKKNHQFIVDVFRVKARLLISETIFDGESFSNLSEHFEEGVIEIKEEAEGGKIKIAQQIKDLSSGAIFVLTARFQLPHSLESKFMPIPTLLELNCARDKEL